jgi:hypothetical protein
MHASLQKNNMGKSPEVKCMNISKAVSKYFNN